MRWDKSMMGYYFSGAETGEYPRKIWEALTPYIKGCHSMLDVGCGPGAWSILALADGMEVYGIEQGKNQIEELTAQLKRRKLDQHFTLLEGNFQDLEIPCADLSVTAFSYSGEIGTNEGIQKILTHTKKVAVFVYSISAESDQFQTSRLNGGNIILKKNAFDTEDYANRVCALGKELGFGNEEFVMTVDYGLVYENIDDALIDFLCFKSSVEDRAAMAKHIEAVTVEKDGKKWISNFKKCHILILRK